ncbi:hypothetical protein FB45DRAFT_935992 [Roridomyces roridus]|uniref:Uncharacterized protein n=1 Tax=Roridomyces roridus TaxID=1738132 RepID=A0AAD7BAJ5_9AGAR|nr:hypothetical protein FB45DRAFT_935992 [Roridomyces roridus]
MSTDCSPSVSLPPELERLIFETTALRYPGRIPTLLLLAKRVHEWIEPLLYQVIPIIVIDERSETYRRMSGSRMLERLRAGDRPLQFFSSAVRDVEILNLELFLGGSENVWADDDLKRVLSACTNMRSLLVIGDLHSKPILSSLADCRPTRVFLISGLEEPIPDFKRPLFRNVTHLVIGELSRVLRSPSDRPPEEGYELERESQWSNILKLPALTHLAVIHPLVPSAGQRILAGAPNLRAFVIVLPDNTHLPSPEQIRALQEIQAFPWDDDRVVVLPAANDLTQGREGFSTKAWTPQVDELWAQVDEFIDDKRRGKIPACEYRLILDSSFSRKPATQ